MDVEVLKAAAANHLWERGWDVFDGPSRPAGLPSHVLPDAPGAAFVAKRGSELLAAVVIEPPEAGPLTERVDRLLGQALRLVDTDNGVYVAIIVDPEAALMVDPGVSATLADLDARVVCVKPDGTVAWS